jgi:hypothetical protein
MASAAAAWQTQLSIIMTGREEENLRSARRKGPSLSLSLSLSEKHFHRIFNERETINSLALKI